MRKFVYFIVCFVLGAAIFCAISGLHQRISPVSLRGYPAAFLLGGLSGILLGQWRRTAVEKQRRLQRRNLVLGAVRSINQLISREKDLDRLLQGVCDILVKNRGYYNAWIALSNEESIVTRTAQAGIGDDFGPFARDLETGKMPRCMTRALRRSRVFITDTPVSQCPGCPLSRWYANRSGVSVRLSREEKIYGVLTVSIKKALTADTTEHELIVEIAGDIAFGLHTREIYEEHLQADAALNRSMHKLDNRVKELNCLFAISRLNERQHLLPEAQYQGIVELIPLAWQYPEITAARIVLHEKNYTTTNFRETPWYLERPVCVGGETVGEVAVYYLENREAADDGPFLKEERALLDTISARLGKTIERRSTRLALEKSEHRFRDLVENSLTGISIVQENRVIFQNQEQSRLLGPLPRQTILADESRVHPGDVEKVRQMSRNIAAGKIRTLDVEFRLLPAEKSQNSRAAMHWVYCRAIPIEYQGQKAILVNMMDVSKTKELENLLLIQDKMASLGRVATGIAHEIRNPLSGINIYLSTLEKMHQKKDGEPKVEQIISQIKSASTKIESVIKRVMDFSRPGEPRFSMIDINRPIEDAVSLTAVTLRKNGITLSKALDETLPRCHGDSNLIEELILNLINNAAESMHFLPSDKHIRVSSELRGNRIYVRVSDSGPGIPLELREKIFDPFFTTKHEGTGIGLSLCHRIVSDHGGTINVYTSQWGGADFVITLPGGNGEKERSR